MTSITIEFQGACTNFQPVEQTNGILPPGVAHRVVLVNADREITIDGHRILPHPAWLQLPTGPSLRLEGCTLKIANPAPPPVSYEPSYFSVIPNLTALMAGVNWVLGPPSPEVVIGNDPALASCYFDFVSGTFSGARNVEAAVTWVVVETEGAPVLTLTPFPGSTMSPQTFNLMSGSTVTVIHAAENEIPDDPYDFLLNYLTAAVMPPDPALPPPNLTQVSVSCSNSTYP